MCLTCIIAEHQSLSTIKSEICTLLETRQCVQPLRSLQKKVANLQHLRSVARKI